MTSRQDISSPIPPDLADADALLTKFGRWAMSRLTRRRCGSAEGQYRAKPDEEDRTPREIVMPTHEAMRVQSALAKVPQKWRLVLELLYVPRRAGTRIVDPAIMLRACRIPPRLSQARHIEGLRSFANIYGAFDRPICYVLTMRKPDTVPPCLTRYEQPTAGSRVSES